ncbi:MAG: DUF2132 domain-containing protein [Candidatus Riflebacteria bacterium]|nr:DUF2132 domain-containing protein [Candidatus Riflebacteria bacterium]
MKDLKTPGKKSQRDTGTKKKSSEKPGNIVKGYQPPKISLEGITLEMMVSKLVEVYGWEAMAKNIKIKCLSNDPSIKSTLNFLRKTPWARNKLEIFYMKFRRAQLKKTQKSHKELC